MAAASWWGVAFLVDVSLKAALLAVLAWAAMAVFRLRAAPVKHRVWVLVLAGMMLMPALVHVVPAVSLPYWLSLSLPTVDGEVETTVTLQTVPSAEMPAEPIALAGDFSLEAAPVDPDVSASEPAIEVFPEIASAGIDTPAPQQQAITQPAPEAVAIWKGASGTILAMAILGIYVIGAGLFLIRLLAGMVWTFGLVRRGSPIAPDTLKFRLPSRTRIAESSEVRVPVTVGCLRPVILLPAEWSTWGDSFLAMVLAHESEHVRRCDTWVTMLAALNRTFYWFHPVAWFVYRRLADLAEEVCDDEVIRQTDAPHDYAQNLLQIASRLSDGSRLRPVGVAMARRASVVRRIESIIDRERPLSQRLGTLAAVLLMALVVPMVLLAAGLKGADSKAVAEETVTVAESGDSGEAESPKAKLRGRVVLESSGEPVANAEVWVLIRHPEKRMGRKSTTTDEQGEFHFEELDEGSYTLAAYHENLASREKRYSGYKAEAGDESIVLKLREAPSLKVKVVTRAEARPLEGATVRLTWTDRKRDHLTDANGEVLIQGLTPETWTIESRAKGFGEDVQAVGLTGTDTVSVTAYVEPGLELFGKVRDEAGVAVEGVGISVFPHDMGGEQIEYMETGADGSFRFEYLPAMGLTLNVSKEDYVRSSRNVTVTVAPGGRQELDLTLPRRPDGGSISGMVTDSNGKPISGASVVNRGGSSSELRETTTDAQGRYRLDDVYASFEKHDLFIKAKGFAPQRLEFEPGTRERPAEVNVRLAPGHRIRGRVVNEQNEPLSGVRVAYAHGDRFPGGDFGGTTNTDKEGRFEFDSLPVESPFAFRKGGYSEMDDVALPLDGKEDVVVTMRSAGVIRGKVVDDSTGRPLSSFTVRVTLSPDREADEPRGNLYGARAFDGEAFAPSDGTFHMADFVRDMPLQVTVKAEGYSPVTVRHVVAASRSESQPIEFRLVRVIPSELLTIAGRVVNEDGKPMVGTELRLIVAAKRAFPRDRFPFNWTMIQSGQTRKQEAVSQFLIAATDRDGRFRFEQVRRGEDMEIAYWGQGVSQDRKVHLERLSAEELENLTITVATPGAVRGKIDRKLYPKFSEILLMSVSGYWFLAQVSADANSYEVRNVPAGRYELQVYGPTQRIDDHGGIKTDVIRRESVQVTSGETLVVDLGAASEEETPSADAEEKPASSKPADSSPASEPKEASAVASAAPAATDSEIVVTGSVVDESGHGIEGARLFLPLEHDDDSRLAMATSDASGSFTIRVPKAWTESGSFFPSRTIWCYAEGHRVAAALAYKQLREGSISPVEFVLDPATNTAFEVKDPDGIPVSGAYVEPLHFYVRSYDILPKRLRELLAGETDEKGRVFFPGLGRDKLRSVQVTADGYGTQQLRLRDSAEEPAMRTIVLRHTGRLEGRLIAGNSNALKDVQVGVYQEDYLGQFTSGTALVEPDKNGRFVVPAFAEGEIKLIIPVDGALSLRPRIPEDLEIFAGETTHVDVPFEPTVRVRGRVQTKGDARPVAEAVVSVQYGSFRQSDHVRTDSDGYFETNVLSGRVRRQLISRPKEYAEWIVEKAGWQSQNAIEVPAGVETFELPPLELVETAERKGRLVDREDRPVVGASIRATKGNRVYAWGESDEQGNFSLRLPQGFEVEEYDASRTRQETPLNATVVTESPLVLQLNE